MASETTAVAVSNVYKSYRSGMTRTEILKNINLTVLKGTIYALLGPSGCGKTTLLKCVIGSLKPDKGSIHIFDQKPGSRNLKIPGSNVGYMPQELALYTDLTVSDILTYFGRIYRMSKDCIASRISLLLNLLNLPNEKSLIRHLSSGQQRRVSFAIALISQPPLLILDEPTVGVDPLLRQNIWNHLLELTELEQVTVIITTHYIQEAKQANMMGFMRFGRILLQDKPEALQPETGTLEDVFLEVCTRDESSQPDDMQITNSNKPPDSEEENFTTEINDRNLLARLFYPMSFTNMSAILIRMWKLVLRSYGMLIIQFISPILALVVLLLTFGRAIHDLTFAVVDLDPVKDQKFLNLINEETFNLILVPDVQTGINMVLDRSAVGVMEIPVNFTNALIERHAYPLRVSAEMLNSTKINLYLDMTNTQILTQLIIAVQQAYLNFTRIILEENNLNEGLASSPFISSPVFAYVSEDFNQFAMPSVMLVLIFFNGLALSAVHSFFERKFGIYGRNIVAGVNPLEEMICHSAVQLVFVIIQVLLMLFVAIFGFQLTCVGNIGLIILICVLIGLCGTFYGHNISSLCESESTGLTVCVSTLIPCIMISAIVWPFEAMPHGMRTFSKFFPLTIPNLSIRDVFFRGISISNSCVWLGLLSSIVWIFIFCLSFIFITKVKD